jgi:hypothetical protein
MTKTRPKQKLTPDDAGYHAKLCERVGWAREAQAEIQGIEASVQSWSAHLRDKYDLVEGDSVQDDGTITRSTAP